MDSQIQLDTPTDLREQTPRAVLATYTAVKQAALLHMHDDHCGTEWHIIGCLRNPWDTTSDVDILTAALAELKNQGLVEKGWDKACADKCPPQDAYRLTPLGVEVAIYIQEEEEFFDFSTAV